MAFSTFSAFLYDLSLRKNARRPTTFETFDPFRAPFDDPFRAPFERPGRRPTRRPCPRRASPRPSPGRASRCSRWSPFSPSFWTSVEPFDRFRDSLQSAAAAAAASRPANRQSRTPRRSPRSNRSTAGYPRGTIPWSTPSWPRTGYRATAKAVARGTAPRRRKTSTGTSPCPCPKTGRPTPFPNPDRRPTGDAELSIPGCRPLGTPPARAPPLGPSRPARSFGRRDRRRPPPPAGTPSSRRASSHAPRWPSEDAATRCLPLATTRGRSGRGRRTPGSPEARAGQQVGCLRGVSRAYPPPNGHRSGSGSSNGRRRRRSPRGTVATRRSRRPRCRAPPIARVDQDADGGRTPAPKRSRRRLDSASVRSDAGVVDAMRARRSAARTTPRTIRARDGDRCG